MLDDKSPLILAQIKNHFEKSDKELAAVDLLIKELKFEDIDSIIDSLENGGYINVNREYITPVITSVNV
ncbi:hypothetical protein [Clostridium sp. YIM B02506]|uniref:hypothetical protein n=1 Tax=Clostridium sp. YIM B02506 TaxID=2910680 RepID=UPI001EEE8CF5|nr:hypothetical protein [Clostridium sp. YIM B02506]